MVEKHGQLKNEVFVTNKTSFCRRLFTSPRFYIVFVVFQVFFIAFFIYPGDSESYNQMLVVTNQRMEEALFNGTTENCEYILL